MTRYKTLHKTDKPNVYWYETKRNGTLFMYRHRYYDSVGKRREDSERGFKSKNQAYRALLDVDIQTSNGNITHLENKNMTVTEFVNIYYDMQKDGWKEKTQSGKRFYIDKWIIPLLGTVKLRELNENTYKFKFIDVLYENELKISTVKAIHNTFKIAMNYAVRKKYITDCDFTKVRLKEEDTNLENFLSGKELPTFLDLAKEHLHVTYYTMILFLAYTGLRYGEACGLSWKYIDFDSKRVTIKEQRDIHGLRSLKTKNSKRTIPLDDDVLEQLKVYYEWCVTIKKKRNEEFTDDSYIFLTTIGTPVKQTSLIHAFTRLYNKTSFKPRITPHGLRHTHATLLLSKKVPVHAVASRLGNTPEMVYRVYAHMFDDLDNLCVTAFRDALKIS